MRKFALLALVVMGFGWSSGAGAASYLRRDGITVDPIQDVRGGDSPYAGNNLAPHAYLLGADLTGAFLNDADLTGANLTNATLTNADLTGAHLYTLIDSDLSNANLSNADMVHANLLHANLTNATLTNANLTGAWLNFANLTDAFLLSADFSMSQYWSSATWTGARYSLNAVGNDGNPIPDTLFPAGMDQAWRDGAGMVAVPEPGTVWLVGIGLGWLGMKRRRQRH